MGYEGKGGSVERRQDGEAERRQESNLSTAGKSSNEPKPEATAGSRLGKTGSRQQKTGSRYWRITGEEDMTEAARRNEGKTSSEGRSGGSGGSGGSRRERDSSRTGENLPGGGSGGGLGKEGEDAAIDEVREEEEEKAREGGRKRGGVLVGAREATPTAAEGMKTLIAYFVAHKRERFFIKNDLAI